MRKYLRMLLLAAVFTALLCGSALAAGEASGIKAGTLQEGKASNVTLKAEDANKSEVAEGSATTDQATNVLPNTVQVGMNVTDAKSGKQYLAVVLKDNSGAPTVDNIVYIDQVGCTTAGSAEFHLYPSSLSSGTTYHIFLSSDEETGGALTEVGNFDYYAPYKLGCVDPDDEITATDAQWVLQMVAQRREASEMQKLAADVDKDGDVTATDAQWLLQVVAQKRTLE